MAQTVNPIDLQNGSSLSSLIHFVKTGWSRVESQERRRRLGHMAPGVLPVILLFVPHLRPWGTPLWIIVQSLLIALPFVIWANFKVMRRPGETGEVFAIAGYVLPVAAMLALFPQRPQIGMLVLAVIALGDGSATLFGRMFGREKLPWNPSKSWAGLIAFTVNAALFGGIYVWNESPQQIWLGTGFSVALATALISGVIESLPSKWHDNLRVATTASIVAAAIHLVLPGI